MNASLAKAKSWVEDKDDPDAVTHATAYAYTDGYAESAGQAWAENNTDYAKTDNHAYATNSGTAIAGVVDDPDTGGVDESDPNTATAQGGDATARSFNYATANNSGTAEAYGDASATNDSYAYAMSDATANNDSTAR